MGQQVNTHTKRPEATDERRQEEAVEVHAWELNGRCENFFWPCFSIAAIMRLHGRLSRQPVRYIVCEGSTFAEFIINFYCCNRLWFDSLGVCLCRQSRMHVMLAVFGFHLFAPAVNFLLKSCECSPVSSECLLSPWKMHFVVIGWQTSFVLACNEVACWLMHSFEQIKCTLENARFILFYWRSGVFDISKRARHSCNIIHSLAMYQYCRESQGTFHWKQPKPIPSINIDVFFFSPQ